MNSKSTPRYQEIGDMVRQLIADGQLLKHTRLPSQNELAARFGVTPMTVLRAMDDLIRDGVVYRKRGAGTFVAPRRNRRPILLVPPADDNRHLTMRTEFAEFFLGAVEAVNEAELRYMPEIIGFQELQRILADLPLIYPQLGGIIFMREFERLRQFLPELQARNIPVMFYGRNLDGAENSGLPCLFHNEYRIAEMTAECLQRHGHRRIGRLINMPIAIHRERLLRECAPQFNLECRPEDVFECRNYPEDLNGLERLVACDAIAAFTDDLAVKVIQYLERDLGLHVPRDLAVIGVNNAPVASQIRPTLTTVGFDNLQNGRRAFRLFADYLDQGGEPRMECCELTLYERESC